MKVTRMKDRESADTFAFLCVHSVTHTAHYACTVSQARAFDQPRSRWWAERGNADMARHEALRWAAGEARRMAWAEFKRAGVVK